MKVLKHNNDPLGAAALDYYNGMQSESVKVFSDQFEADTLPVHYFFRTLQDMPDLEKRALELSAGKVLDVGAGVGVHAKVLQERGFDVDAIDISPGCVDVMKMRGISNAYCADFYQWTEKHYDTLLLLMNGIGFIGNMKNFYWFIDKARKLLNKGGQIIFDSSDLIYLYEPGEFDILSEQMDYYGEVKFWMTYKNIRGTAFRWLYLAPDALMHLAERLNFHFEIIQKDKHYGFLGKITF